jgi:optic atrophy 3 protein
VRVHVFASILIIVRLHWSSHSLAKLGGLLIKTLAKPVSKRIKHEFSKRELTQRFLINIGQYTHQMSSRMTIWSAGYKVRSIKPLEEEKAMKDGAELIGEGFILFVSGGIIVWEYNKSKEKEQKKAEEKRQEAKAERRALQAKLHALDVRVQALEKVIKANSQGLFAIVSEKYTPPPSQEVVPIDDDTISMDSDNTVEAVERKPDTAAKQPAKESKAVAVKQETLPVSVVEVSKEKAANQASWWWWPFW